MFGISLHWIMNATLACDRCVVSASNLFVLVPELVLGVVYYMSMYRVQVPVLCVWSQSVQDVLG